MEVGTLYNPGSASAGQIETGLGNQMWGLLGNLLQAHVKNYTLCLPAFTSTVHKRGSTQRIPFEDLFNSSVFIAGMRQVGVRCVHIRECAHLRGNVSSGSARITGWMMNKKMFRYKLAHALQNDGSMSLTTPFQTRDLLRHWQAISTQMYKSLQLSDSMERIVHQLMTSAQLKGSDYGCVHARVESDIKHAAGPQTELPTLVQYLKWARSIATDTQGRGSVNDSPFSTDLHGHDEAVLGGLRSFAANATHRHQHGVHGTEGLEHNRRRPTVYLSSSSWLDVAATDPNEAHNASAQVRWVQSPFKTGFDSVSFQLGINVTYLFASLVDFSICRRAKWFVGLAFSSFSRILAEYQALDNKNGWYSACVESAGGLRYFPAEQLHVLYTNWSTCPVDCSKLNIKVVPKGSFGWGVSCK
jgi:hypothetical protein